MRSGEKLSGCGRFMGTQPLSPLLFRKRKRRGKTMSGKAKKMRKFFRPTVGDGEGWYSGMWEGTIGGSWID